MTSTQTDRIDGLSTSVAVKAPVRAATTANVTLSGIQTIDGTTLSTGDRVLVKEQDSAAENGIYCVSSSDWVRSKDFDGNRDVVEGTIVWVANGTVNGDTFFQVTNAGAITISSTELTFLKVNGAFTGTYQHPSGVARSVTDKFGDVVSIEDFGPTGDGVADDTAVFTTALAALSGGGVLKLGRNRTYLVRTASGILFNPPANLVIEGEGHSSVIKIDTTLSGTAQLFQNTNTNLTFKDLKFTTGDTFNADGLYICQWAANDLTFDNVHVDGGATDETGKLTSLILTPSASDQENLTVRNCKLEKMNRMILKANSDTSTQKHIKILNNTFDGFVSSPVSFNSPNGSQEDIVITGNNFRDANLATTPLTAFVAIASGDKIVIAENSFAGGVNEMIHLEEKVTNFSIVGNVGACTGMARAVYVGDNDGAGSDFRPENGVIVGNTFEDLTGTSADGINFIFDASPISPAAEIVVSDNVLKGFGDAGITLGGFVEDNIIVHDNICKGCGVGINAVVGNLDVYNNLLSDCTTGILVSNGGMLGFTRFENCATNVTATNGKVTLKGFSINMDRQTLTGSGATDITLMPRTSADRLFGTVTAHVYANSSNEDISVEEVAWDGTTYTRTVKLAYPGGQLSASFPDITDLFKLRVDNSSTVLNNATVQVQFDGAYVAG